MLTHDPTEGLRCPRLTNNKRSMPTSKKHTSPSRSQRPTVRRAWKFARTALKFRPKCSESTKSLCELGTKSSAKFWEAQKKFVCRRAQASDTQTFAPDQITRPQISAPPLVGPRFHLFRSSRRLLRRCPLFSLVPPSPSLPPRPSPCRLVTPDPPPILHPCLALFLLPLLLTRR